MIVKLSIEHVDWVTRLIQHARDSNPTYVAAEIQAENEWVHHVNEVADRTLYPRGNSWHQGDVIHTAQASMPRDVGSRLNWPIDRALAEPGASNAKPLMRTASSSTWARCGDGGCLNIGDG